MPFLSQALSKLNHKREIVRFLDAMTLHTYKIYKNLKCIRLIHKYGFGLFLVQI